MLGALSGFGSRGVVVLAGPIVFHQGAPIVRPLARSTRFGVARASLEECTRCGISFSTCPLPFYSC